MKGQTVDEDCIFCKIWKNKVGIIYKNWYFFAQFDKYPVSPGHAEIISKRHFTSIFDIKILEWLFLLFALFGTVRRIERTNLRELYTAFLLNPLDQKSEWFCKKMLGHIGLKKNPDGYNIGINEGEAAGRTVHHLHLHIIPRYFGDVKKSRGGLRNIIPGMGNYKNKNPASPEP